MKYQIWFTRTLNCSCEIEAESEDAAVAEFEANPPFHYQEGNREDEVTDVFIDGE